MFKNVIIISVALLIAVPLFAEVIRRGDAIRDVEPTALAAVLSDPAAFDGTPIVTSGVVSRACRKKGCWMELSDETSGRSMRVSFKDYAFFVPLDAEGSFARLDGVVKVKKLSKSEADHYEEDGGTLVRGADGTAVEISFTASGVELTPPPRS